MKSDRVKNPCKRNSTMFNKRESENMETTTLSSIQAMREAHAPQQDAKQRIDRAQWITERGAYPPLEQVTKPNLTTAEASFYLNRRPQTMRIWAMNQHPIRPLNIHGRLAWPVSELRRLLSGGAK